MATETTVRAVFYLAQGTLEITGASVALVKEEMKAAGLPAKMLKDLNEHMPGQGVAAGAVNTPSETDEPQSASAPVPEPEPEPEPEPAPSLTVADVRPLFEKLVALGDSQFVVQTLTALEAKGPDGRINIQHLPVEKLEEAKSKAEARIAELESAKESAGSVL